MSHSVGLAAQASYGPKRFFCRASVFLVVGFAIMNGLASFMIRSRLKPVMVGREVWVGMDHARDHTSATTLVLGDSVARQLYDRSNERDTGFMHVTTNQAISLAGQELVLQAAVRTNPQLRRIVLVYFPGSFANDLSQPFTYNYFVKPFCDYATWSRLSPLVKSQLKRRPELWLAFLPLVKATQAFSNVDYGTEPEDPSKWKLSSISIEALPRIQEFCLARGIKFEIRPPPMAATQDIDWLARDVKLHGLSGVFAGYFEHVVRLPPKSFEYGYHLAREALPGIRANGSSLIE